jgi:hypothetical protein
LEFGKAAAQIFFLERATIVRAQGASEEKKFAAKPTQPNSKFVTVSGIIDR